MPVIGDERKRRPEQPDELHPDTEHLLCSSRREDGRVASVPRRPRPTKASLGTTIRALRQEHGLTIETLAHNADLHPTYVSGIERGRHNPTLDVLNRLASALHIRLSELIRLSETSQSE
jgi:ribosome-binding protein aMBF1 (putative translation factor)